MSQFILYGMTHSLYSGKARSYLLKQNIDFREITAGHPDFVKHIMPQIGRWIIPVLKTPEGEIVQDGSDIIDWFEDRNLARISAYPKTPRQLIISLIFELFGGEGLLRPAMHYRWNFDEANIDFIEDQFGLFSMPLVEKADRAEIVTKTTGQMRAAGKNFGVVPETYEAIEKAYKAFLIKLNVHFSAVPYLLGGVPTIGDYGLFAALFAHLGRDPQPATLMKQIAPAVYRWTERMNATNPDMPEFIDCPEALMKDDAIPETLVPVLRTVTSDYLPEIEAFIEAINDWLEQQDDLREGDIIGGQPRYRSIGNCTFDWNGTMLTAGIFPYRVYLLQKIQDAYDLLNPSEKTTVDHLLDEVGLAPILTSRTTRRVERKDNREVWGARR